MLGRMVTAKLSLTQTSVLVPALGQYIGVYDQMPLGFGGNLLLTRL